MTGPTATWPPERLYWSILDAPGWRRRGVLPSGLRPLFEDDVPLPGDAVHAVSTPLPDGRVLVCAAVREDLAGLDLLSLAPSSLPPCIEADVDPALLNLLVGEFEPRPYRRARSRRQLATALAVLACCSLMAVGLDRRAGYHRAFAQEAREARIGLMANVAPNASQETIRAALASLRRSADASRLVQPPQDATLALADLLRGWPAEVRAQPQTLIVSSSTIGMAVLVEGSPVAFLEALHAPSGWTPDQPRLTSVDRMTRLDLRFRPAAEGGRP